MSGSSRTSPFGTAAEQEQFGKQLCFKLFEQSDIMSITPHAITHIYETKDVSRKPVLQITELRKISATSNNPNAQVRFRLALSDGEKFIHAMLATQLNNLVTDQLIQLNYLVRLGDFICNEVQNKRIIIVLTLDVVGALPNRIGNPVLADGTGNAEPPRQQFSAPPPSHQTNGGGGMQQNGGGYAGSSNGNWRSNTVSPSNAYGTVKQDSPNPYRSSSGAMAPIVGAPTQVYRPIQTINPYQNGWTIRGRCTYKSDLRKYQNARGEGQVISFELTDESGSIRITAFTELAPRVEETVRMGRLYSVTRGSLKHANEKFNRSTSQYEMTLDMRSEFTEVPDDGNTIKVKFNFTKIANLDSIEVKGMCDVIGIVQTVGPLGEITLRSTGEPCKKRNISICDDSNATVELTLWRNQAESFLKEEDQNRHPVLLIKNASRGDFGGVCLNMMRSSSLELDPVNIPEADQLRAWYDSSGGAMPMTQLTASSGASGKVTGERKSLEEAFNEDVDPVFSSGAGGSAMFVMRGYVSFIKSDGEISYPSDPETKKKVVEVSPGLWHSPSTDRQLRDEEVVRRYIMNLKVSDHTGSKWMSAFDESGQVICSKNANDMWELKKLDYAMYESVLDDAKFRPFVMRVQVREQEYKGERQIRYTMSRCEPVDYVAESRAIIEEIKNYN